MRGFFSSSPKKSKEKLERSSREKLIVPAAAPVRQRLPENLARYLRPDGTMGRALITFKDISSRCDSRIFETSYPLMGQRTELTGKPSSLQVGEIILQVFRLPPLPGIAPEQLPQSLDECHRGLRHVNWHKVTYFEGILTQNGGDCSVSLLSFQLCCESLCSRASFLVMASPSAEGDRIQTGGFQRCY